MSYYVLKNTIYEGKPIDDVTVEIFPLGGGFVRRVPRSVLTKIEPPTSTRRLTKVALDCWEDVEFDAWILEPDRWNGWVCPAFDRATVERIIELSKSDCPHDDCSCITLSWNGYDIVETNHGLSDYPEEMEERTHPFLFKTKNGETLTLWPVGSHNWCWYETTPED